MSRFTNVLIPREKWGARQPKAVDTNFQKTGGIVIHHSAVKRTGAVHYPDCYKSVQGHQNYHMNTKGWNDIAYNFVVCQHGFIFEGRGWGAQNGANTPLNTSTLSVCFDGNTQFEEVGLAARLSILAVVDTAVSLGWYPKVRGHGQATGTSSCPGTNLQSMINAGLFKPSSPITPQPAEPTPTPVPPQTPEVPVSGAAAPVLGPSTVTVEKMQSWATKRLGTRIFVENAILAYEESLKLGVDPAVTYAVMAHETGYGKYGGVVTPEMHNWGGMKTAAGGGNYDTSAHATFVSDRYGIRAVAQHLALYAGLYVPHNDIVDPRHFDAVRGRAKVLPSDSWTWASDGPGWSQRVYEKIKDMQS